MLRKESNNNKSVCVCGGGGGGGGEGGGFDNFAECLSGTVAKTKQKQKSLKLSSLHGTKWPDAPWKLQLESTEQDGNAE